jgi:5-formyltetrahydrofolate cyclo-ligase
MADKRPPATCRFVSPPCLASEIDPDYFDPLAVDPEQALDVTRWRRAERIRLRTARAALSVADRQAAGAVLSAHLRRFLAERFAGAAGLTLSAYWPIKGEPDLRPLMGELHGTGVTIVLPVVEVKAAPLAFRHWSPGMPMVLGDWNIPVPPPETETLTPDIALAPLVGWDGAGFRLGYGGGYFDRTLAALSPRPFTIGIGLQSAHLSTIFPQPHDIALDVILTDAGVQFHREGP